jgi:hypothetical protein
MNTIEKRKYIENHLDRVDEVFITEVYQKMKTIISAEEPIVGYEASGSPITKNHFIADTKEAVTQIERGEFLSLEDLEKESESW